VRFKKIAVCTIVGGMGVLRAGSAGAQAVDTPIQPSETLPQEASPSSASPSSTSPSSSQKPLFEIGIAAGAGYIPDYPGAGQSHVRGIAVPYVIYRGDFLQTSQSGIRGRLYQSNRVTFDLSLDGTLGSQTNDDKARAGMPKIDYLGEIGPGVKINLAHPDPTSRFDIDLPVRAAFSTDFSRGDFRGFDVAPDLAYAKSDLFEPGTRLRIGIGPVFASTRLMNYFYEVKPQYANAGRPQYGAKAGYLGSRLQTSLSVPLTDRISAFGGVRGDLFSGAANESSPLLKRTVTLSVGGGFTYSLYKSSSTTTVTDDFLN